jgi:hypothetical protein
MADHKLDLFTKQRRNIMTDNTEYLIPINGPWLTPEEMNRHQKEYDRILTEKVDQMIREKT